MNDESRPVTGAGGVGAPPSELANGLANVNSDGPCGSGVVECEKKVHWVKAELRWKDTKEPVLAAECRILQTETVINAGPLSTGLESRNLPAGTYSVTFPDIDAMEWSEG